MPGPTPKQAYKPAEEPRRGPACKGDPIPWVKPAPSQKRELRESLFGSFQNFSSGRIGVPIALVTRFFWKISMDEVDEFLAAAIRTAWLQVDGPASRSHYNVGVETARRVRAALEREGFVITRAQPTLKAKGEQHNSDFGGAIPQGFDRSPKLTSKTESLIV